MSEPDSGNSSVSEPQTRNINVSEPHTQNINVNDPPLSVARVTVSEPHNL